MSQAAFDTYEYVKQLRKVGVPEEQAEVHAHTLAELINQKLVTREYLDLRLQQIEQQIDRRFDQVDRRFEQVEHRFEQVELRMEQMGNQLMVRLGSLIVGVATLLGALIAAMTLITQ